MNSMGESTSRDDDVAAQGHECPRCESIEHTGPCFAPPRQSASAAHAESAAERDRRRRKRADEARPNVSMTPGQAETLAEASSAAQGRRWWQFWRDPEPPPRRQRIGIVNAPGAKASVRGTTFGAGLDIGIVNDGEIDSEGSTHE